MNFIPFSLIKALMPERIRFSWFQVPQFFHGDDVYTGGHLFLYVCCVMVK
jgi:hypothetical protein